MTMILFILFYERQSFHLAILSSYLNREGWKKHIFSTDTGTSPFTAQQISTCMYEKKIVDLGREIEVLFNLAPEDVPAECQFLLEIGLEEITK